MNPIKNKLFKTILTVAIGFSTLAPTYAFASEKEEIPQSKVTSTVPLTNVIENNPQSTQGTIETQGLKKDALVFALRHGGKALDDLLDFLGVSSKEAKYVLQHADKIADFLESTTNQLEQRLLDFLIFQCGIPQGFARVITYAISGFVL
ncbi:hypothetical protein [Paenibacillus sp. 8b26]|uniref:hypothetical protein n=1 Tax=Paenibacillus sp. 8b26 TaxID=3424133 RepID=UPI003D657802